MKRTVIVIALALFAGCGLTETSRDVVNADKPLTIDVWNSMEIDAKYELETLERLRACDPNLKQDAQWNRFMKEVIVPQRRKDILTDY